MSTEEVVVRVPARLGLVGNPSDLHGGAVLAVPLPAFGATVGVTVQRGVTVVDEVTGATDTWPDVGAFRDHVAGNGHPAHCRVVTAALVRVVDHLGRRPARSVAGLTVRFASDIPRSVGLAGSSALAVATVEAVARRAGWPLDPDVVAALALAAEAEELGIAAGWQDRIVQARRSPVLVDAGRPVTRDGMEVPTVRDVHVTAPTRLVVGWRSADAEESGDQHSRAPRGDVVAAMRSLADEARRAADALGRGDGAALAGAVERTWRVREACVPLRPDHAELVEAARRSAWSATTPGSGGSVVVVVPGRAGGASGDDADRVRDLLVAEGAATAEVVVGPTAPPAPPE